MSVSVTYEGYSEETANLWQFHAKQCPTHIGAVFGDAVGNLRASLDHIVHQLAILTCPNPHPRTSFPIVMKPDDYPSQAGDRLKNVPAEAWELIECLQPYNRSYRPDLYDLWLIKKLCDRDKHRLLNLVAARVHITSSNGVDIWLDGPLKDGDKLSMSFAPPKESYEVTIAARVGVPVENENVGVEGLRLFHDFIRDDVIPLFAGFFDERVPFRPLPRKPRKKDLTCSATVNEVELFHAGHIVLQLHLHFGCLRWWQTCTTTTRTATRATTSRARTVAPARAESRSARSAPGSLAR